MCSLLLLLRGARSTLHRRHGNCPRLGTVTCITGIAMARVPNMFYLKYCFASSDALPQVRLTLCQLANDPFSGGGGRERYAELHLKVPAKYDSEQCTVV